VLSDGGPAAESALGIGPPEPRASGAGFDQIEGVQRLVTRLATTSPLLVAVDELQWCDRPSLDFLCFLGHRASQLPVTIIAAWRRGEPGVRAGRLQALAGKPETFFLTPSPLSPAGIRELLRRATGTQPHDDAVKAVHAQTGGQPFLVTELVAGLQLRAVPVGPRCGEAIAAVTPESVRRKVVARLGRHPETVQQFARTAAVLGDASLAQATALAGVDQDAARDAADALVRAGFLRDDASVGYADPIVRKALYDTLSSRERAELHQQAAALLCGGATGPDPRDRELAAGHLLSCEPAGDPSLGDVLRQAAGRAVDQGAPTRARRFLARALGELDEAGARSAVLVQLAELELDSGYAESAVEHARAALESAPTPADRVDATLAYAQALAATADWDAALELLDGEALSAPPGEPDLKLRLPAAAALLRVCRGAPQPELEGLGASIERLTGDTAPERVLLAVYASELALTGAADARHVAELCGRAIGDGSPHARGDFADAADYLAARAALLADAGHLTETVIGRHAPGLVAHALQAQLALARGMLDVAHADALAALGLLADLPLTVLRRRIRSDLLTALVVTETARDCGEAVDEALAELRDDGETTAPTLACLKLAVALARSEPVEPAGEAENAPLGAIAPGCCRRSLAALAHHAAGDTERALQLATEHLAFARKWGGASLLGQALVVRGVVDPGAERLRFIEEAVAVLEGGPSELELARAAIELGTALRRARRRRESREQLVHGADLAHRCGALALAARARAELVSAGARPRRTAFTGIGSLTVSELRVARLAATGLTNREIAQELIVSAKTVSGQLSAVYRKLDVHDRAALALAMEADDSDGVEPEPEPEPEPVP
jgi:DNA-binding CsgD family transcriptional regulator